MARQVDKSVGEIGAAGEKPDWRHQDVADKGADDPAKRCTDNDPDRHVEHIAAKREFTKILKDTFFPQQSFRTSQMTHAQLIEKRVFASFHETPPGACCAGTDSCVKDVRCGVQPDCGASGILKEQCLS